jgi:hypothetical protein
MRNVPEKKESCRENEDTSYIPKLFPGNRAIYEIMRGGAQNEFFRFLCNKGNANAP